jgi:hypothetical protein
VKGLRHVWDQLDFDAELPACVPIGDDSACKPIGRQCRDLWLAGAEHYTVEVYIIYSSKQGCQGLARRHGGWLWREVFGLGIFVAPRLYCSTQCLSRWLYSLLDIYAGYTDDVHPKDVSLCLGVHAG